MSSDRYRTVTVPLCAGAHREWNAVAMQIVLDRNALERRAATKLALRVLEAAISHVFGFALSVQHMELWASPSLFEESHTPDRFVTLPPMHDLEAGADPAPALTERVKRDVQRIRKPAPHGADDGGAHER